MGYSIAGQAVMGIAFEGTSGTYTAPTKYVPFLDENLEYKSPAVQRRVIRAQADLSGTLAGHGSVDGTITVEATDDILPYFLRTMRTTCSKTGTTPNFTYAYTPVTAATPPNATLSVTINRGGNVFGYVGCVVSKMTLSVNNEILQAAFDIVGVDESTQSAPTPTWNQGQVFGAGMWDIEIPTATQVFDVDTFSLEIDESATVQYRLKNTGFNQGRGAQFVSLGERTVQLSASRDFTSLTDYTAFKAGTAQSITVACMPPGVVTWASAVRGVQFVVPVAAKDGYSLSESAQGDLLRADLTYICSLDGTGNAYYINIKTGEVVPAP